MIELISSNTLLVGGNSTGDSITCTETSLNAAPYAANFYPDGIAPPATTTRVFSDWGGNLFNGFGYFCIYDTTAQTYFYPAMLLFTTFSTVVFTFEGDDYMIKYGIRIQGYYTFNIKKTSGNRPFRFVCWGNLGSDTNTSQANESTTINIKWGTRTYYYFRTFQTNLTSKTFQIGVVPYDGSINTAAYTANFNAGAVDQLVFYTSVVTTGLNMYMKKGSSTNYDWVGYDLSYDPKITFTESVNSSYGSIGDTLKYNFTITNNGTTGNNFVFLNTIPNGTFLIRNSFSVNDVTIPDVTPNGGVTVGTLSLGTTTISFKVLVNAIPSVNPISNIARIDYIATIATGTLNEVHPYIDSNTVTTQIVSCIVDGVKTSDKHYVTANDIVTYTIALKNTGTVSANNFIVRDTIPTGETFITNSITLNGITIGGTPASINVGTIAAGAISTIAFKVKIT